MKTFLAIGTLVAALGGMAAAYVLEHQGGYKQGHLDAEWTCSQKH